MAKKQTKTTKLTKDGSGKGMTLAEVRAEIKKMVKSQLEVFKADLVADKRIQPPAQ